MKSTFIFGSWRHWMHSFLAGVKNLLFGLCRILFAIILGVVSLAVHSWRLLCRFIGRNPNIALGTFIVIAVLAWLLTFVSMRARATSAENQRDSIAWQYQDFKTSHGYE